MLSTLCKCVVAAAVCATSLFSQSAADDSGRGVFGGATPMIVGAFGFTGDINNSSNLSFGPKFEPIAVVPLGSKFLFETEYSMELPVEREEATLGAAVLSHSFEYMQMSYAATPNLVVTGGQFVTPFGIYKERMDPQWVRNILEEPLIFPINDNSSIGAMVRAGTYLSSGVKLNVTADYSGSEGNAQFSGEKQTGGRVSLFFPGPRLEVGASYSRELGDERFNVAGTDFVWNARRTPLDVRGECIWADVLGKGYWAEGAWRLSNLSGNRFFRHSQVVGRAEQYFAPAKPQDLIAELQTLDTRRYTAGLNYWPTDGVKFSVSYGRQMDASESLGVWTLGVVYRFAWGMEGR